MALRVVLLVVVGLCLGSFINALVWRVHENDSSRRVKLSILRGRSMCPSCGHKLSPQDLMPVFSWILLKGRCRYCGRPISYQYPAIELLTLILFLISWFFWPYGFKPEGSALFIIWLLILTGLVALVVYDLRWKLLPNKIVFPIIALTVGQLIFELILSHRRGAYLEGEFFGLIFSAGVFYSLYLISGGKWIGGGDVKLAIAIGLLVGGPAKAILVVFGASLIGSLMSVPLIAIHKLKKDSLIAFGPFLICATFICYLFGSNIISWYQRLIVR